MPSWCDLCACCACGCPTPDPRGYWWALARLIIARVLAGQSCCPVRDNALALAIIDNAAALALGKVCLWQLQPA